MNDSFELPPNKPEEKQKDLRFWHGLLGLLYVLGMGVFFVLVMGVAASMGLNPMSTPMVVFQTLIICAIIGASAMIVITRRGLAPWKALWLDRFPAAASVASVVGVVAFGILVDQTTFLLHQYKPGLFSTEHLESFALVFKNASIVGFIALTLVVSVGPAIGEELMFRGLVFQSFRRDMSVALAIIYSSILFGIIHFNWLQGVGAGLLGVYLAFVVWSTRSLFPAMVAHFSNNLISCLFSRFDNEGVGQAYQKGHDAVMLAGAGVVLLAAIIYFLQMKKRSAQSS